MKKVLFSWLLIFACNLIAGQQLSLKEQSIVQFKNENYAQAILLMEKALKDNPNDAEIYYYLGFFNHYNAYDSRPLQGYDSTYSLNVLHYLDKALEIKPNYGDAKYFYFTECGAAAFKEYQNNNPQKVKAWFDKAFHKGAIPEWGIELGKNMLSLCDSNAILFTHGDFSLNICLFVQLHDDFRKDITIVPLALLDRPSFVLALNNNADSKILRGLNTGLTKEQIIDMHPYKWDTLTMKLAVPTELLKQYFLPDNYTMDWVIEPDLISNRMASKIDDEIPQRRTYVSPTRAMLLNIIEVNKWVRPVYFTNTYESYLLAGLDKYLQYAGLVSKLLPVKTEKTWRKIDVDKLEQIVFNTKLGKLKTKITDDQPRASGITSLYNSSYWYLADYYRSKGENDKVEKVIESYKQNLMIGYDSETELGYLGTIVII